MLLGFRTTRGTKVFYWSGAWSRTRPVGPVQVRVSPRRTPAGSGGTRPPDAARGGCRPVCLPPGDAGRDIDPARCRRRVGVRPSRVPTGGGPSAGSRRLAAVHRLPALAAPLIALGFSATAAFAVLNGLLLAGALYVCASRLHWTWCAIVFAGPILWWLDKPHTEPFTFALYAITFALFDAAPWWSLVAAGAASTQDPGNAALVGILAAAAVAGRAALLRDGRYWAGLAAGVALAALHPAYYLLRLGGLTRLASTGSCIG